MLGLGSARRESVPSCVRFDQVLHACMGFMGLVLRMFFCPLFAVVFLCSMGLVRSGAYIKGSEYAEI